MVDLATERDITTIPKVELHVHLNGPITEATASTLARRHGADPENALRLIDGRYPGRYPNFEGFLDTYLAANEFVRTQVDLELVTAEFARAQAAQNIVYSEAIFTAMIFIRNGMEPAAMWAALRRGLVAAGPSTRVALVVDVIRDLGQHACRPPCRTHQEWPGSTPAPCRPTLVRDTGGQGGAARRDRDLDIRRESGTERVGFSPGPGHDRAVPEKPPPRRPPSMGLVPIKTRRGGNLQ